MTKWLNISALLTLAVFSALPQQKAQAQSCAITPNPGGVTCRIDRGSSLIQVLNSQTITNPFLLTNVGTPGLSHTINLAQGATAILTGNIGEGPDASESLTVNAQNGGGSVIILRGVGTYTGETFITGTNMTLEVANAMATSAINVGANTILRADAGANARGFAANNANRTNININNGTFNLNGRGAPTGTTGNVFVGNLLLNGGTISNGSITSNGVWDVRGGVGINSTISAYVRGTGNFTINKSGAGILTLSAADTLDLTNQTFKNNIARLNINEGTVLLGAGSSAGDGLVTIRQNGILDLGGNNIDFSTGNFVLDGGRITNGRISALGAVDLRSGTLAADITTNGGPTTVDNNPLSFNKTTSGTVTITTAQTGRGLINIIGGQIILDPNASLIRTPGIVIYRGAALTTSAAEQINNAAGISVNGTFTMGGNETIGNLNGISAGTIQMGANNLTVSGAGVYAGAISGGGKLIKTGTGTLILSGGGQSYTGNTDVTGGTLRYSGGIIARNGRTNHLADTSILTITNGGVDLGGSRGENIARVIVDNGALTNGTVIAANDYDLRSGLVSANLGGTVGLNKSTAGTLTLAGVNTYTGATNLAAGTIEAARTNALNRSTVTMNGGILRLGRDEEAVNSPIIAQNVTQNSAIVMNGALNRFDVATRDSGTILGVVSEGPSAGTHVLEKTGAGRLILGGINTFHSGIVIENGVLQANRNESLGATGNVIELARGLLNVGRSGRISQLGRVISLSDDGGGFDVSSRGTLVLDTDLQHRISLTDASQGFEQSVGSITKSGLGVLAITQNQTTVGDVNVTGGTLALYARLVSSQEIATTAPLADRGFNISGGTLRLYGPGRGLAANAATDHLNDNSANVTVSGTGTFDLGRTSETVKSVTLNGGRIINGTITATGAAGFDLQSGLVSAVLAGNQAVHKTGTGTVILSGTNTYSGGTFLDGGILQVSRANNLGSGNVTITMNGGRLNYSGRNVRLSGLNATAGTNRVFLANNGMGGFDVNAGNTMTLDYTLLAPAATQGGQPGVSSGSLEKTGRGALLFSSGQTYTGDTFLRQGNVRIAVPRGGTPAASYFSDTGSLEVGTSSAVLANLDLGRQTETIGSLILRGGTITNGGLRITDPLANFELQSGRVTAQLTGAGGLVKTTGNTVTLTGTNDFTGDIQLDAGVLSIASAANLGRGTIIFNGGRLGISQNLTFGQGGTGVHLAFNPTATGSNSGFDIAANRTVILNTTIQSNDATGAVNNQFYKYGNGTLDIRADQILTQDYNQVAGTTILSSGTLQAPFVHVTGGTLRLRGGITHFTPDSVFNMEGGRVFVDTSDSIGNLSSPGLHPAVERRSNITIARGQNLTILQSSTFGTLGGFSYVGTISGPGGLIFFPGGIEGSIQSLFGANSYSGGTVVNSGNVSIFNPRALGTGTVFLNSGATLNIGDTNVNGSFRPTTLSNLVDASDGATITGYTATVRNLSAAGVVNLYGITLAGNNRFSDVARSTVVIRGLTTFLGGAVNANRLPDNGQVSVLGVGPDNQKARLAVGFARENIGSLDVGQFGELSFGLNRLGGSGRLIVGETATFAQNSVISLEPRAGSYVAGRIYTLLTAANPIVDQGAIRRAYTTPFISIVPSIVENGVTHSIIATVVQGGSVVNGVTPALAPSLVAGSSLSGSTPSAFQPGQGASLGTMLARSADPEGTNSGDIVINFNKDGSPLGTLSGDLASAGATHDTHGVYQKVALTGTQAAVGGMLDKVVSAGLAPNSDLENVVGHLNLLNAEQARAAYDQIAGTAHSQITSMQRQASSAFADLLSSRLSQLSFGGTTNIRRGSSLALSGQDLGEGDSTEHSWMKNFTYDQQSGAGNNESGLGFDAQGFVMGNETPLTPHFTFGAAAGQVNLNGSTDQDTATIDAYQAAFYGKYQFNDGFYLQGAMTLSRQDIETRRGLDFAGISRQANQHHTDYAALTQFETGREIDLGRVKMVAHLGLDFQRQFLKDFRESGADSLGLEVSRNDTNSAHFLPGVSFSGDFKFADATFRPYADFTYAQELVRAKDDFRARLAGSDTSFLVDDSSTESGDHAYVRAGFAMDFQDDFLGAKPSLYFDYAGDYGQQTVDHALTTGINFTW